MTGEGLAGTTRFLVLALSALYALAAIAGIGLVDFGSTRDRALFTLLLLVGAVLLVAGQLLMAPGTVSAVVVCVGAVIGGLPLFWTLLVPVAVAVVIASTIKLTRQGPSPAA
ncbi:MAG TPA: hypothetical protein VFV56_03020 [Gaiellaceae bacterium]|jgi:hypothetical protein|nr:hypothetical protein [Gaiellaceae bacterium]